MGGEKKEETEKSEESKKNKELEKKIDELKKEIQKKNDEIKKLEEEKNKYYEQMMRTAADMDNYRKYMEKEMKRVVESANERLMSSLIDVVEDLERAVAVIRKECGNSAALGVELIHKHFLRMLINEGLSVIESVGKEFDPDIHEVVSVVEDKSKKDNIIIEEVRKGYMFKNKIIRPSRVVVNKLKEGDEHGKDNRDRPGDE